MPRLKYGKTFRTRAGRLGRYVYRGSKRVGFKAVRSGYRVGKSGFKTGVRRYVADRTYRYGRKRWG